MERPCVECIFYSYTISGYNPAVPDYIFKMKDLARFSGAQDAPTRHAPTMQVQAQVQMITISADEAGQRIDNFLLLALLKVRKILLSLVLLVFAVILLRHHLSFQISMFL